MRTRNTSPHFHHDTLIEKHSLSRLQHRLVVSRFLDELRFWCNLERPGSIRNSRRWSRCTPLFCLQSNDPGALNKNAANFKTTFDIHVAQFYAIFTHVRPRSLFRTTHQLYNAHDVEWPILQALWIIFYCRARLCPLSPSHSTRLRATRCPKVTRIDTTSSQRHFSRPCLAHVIGCMLPRACERRESRTSNWKARWPG